MCCGDSADSKRRQICSHRKSALAMFQIIATAYLLLLLSLLGLATSFHRHGIPNRAAFSRTYTKADDSSYEFSNPITKALEAFLPSSPTSSSSSSNSNSPIGKQSKRAKTSLASLALDLGKALKNAEWFVTGNVDNRFFSDDFRFQDPDVKVTGIQEYARGVRKLFDQTCTRGEIVSVRVNDTLPNTITVTWRLEGKVNIGGGIKIKAFVVYTNLLVDERGLVVFQEDKFSLPSYDILLSAFLPFLYTDMGLLAPAAPPVALLREAFSKLKKL